MKTNITKHILGVILLTVGVGAMAQTVYRGNGYEGSGIIYGAPEYAAPDYGNAENTTEYNPNTGTSSYNMPQPPQLPQSRYGQIDNGYVNNDNSPVYQNIPQNTTVIREIVPVPIYVEQNNYPYYQQPYPYGRVEDNRDNRDNRRIVGRPLNPTRSNPTFAPNPQPDASNSNNRSFQDRRIRGPNFNERLDKRLN